MRYLLVAAGDRHADGIDESQTRQLDHLRRHLLEIEGDNELRQHLTQLLPGDRSRLVASHSCAFAPPPLPLISASAPEPARKSRLPNA